MANAVPTRVAHPNGGERSYGIRFDERAGPGPHAVVFVGNGEGWALDGTYALPVRDAEAMAESRERAGIRAHVGAILVDAPDAGAETTYREIPLAQIAPSRTNHRRRFFGRELQELGQSMLQSGVISPVLVRTIPLTGEEPKPGAPLYELVVGERRYRAALQVKLATIPAIVREISDAEMVETQLVENFQRADIPPLDEADAYTELVATGRYGSGHEAIAELALRLGKTALHVAQRLSLGALTPGARDALDVEKISLGHALLLATLDPVDQDRELTALLVEKRWSTSGTWIDQPLDVAKISVADLRASLLKAHREIASAKFDPKDETLGGRGACGPCGRCTGGNSLFGLEESARCLDSGCWDVKTRNLLARNVEAARTEHGPDVILLGQKETYGGQAKPAWNYQRTETPVEGSVPAVDLDSGGRTVHVVPVPPSQETESATAREARERRERNAAESKVRADVAATVLGLIGEDPTPDPLVRFLAGFYLNRIPTPYLHRALAFVGKEPAREMDPADFCPEDLLQMVVVGAIAHEAREVSSFEDKPQPQPGTVAAAEAYSLDLATIRLESERRTLGTEARVA